MDVLVVPDFKQRRMVNGTQRTRHWCRLSTLKDIGIAGLQRRKPGVQRTSSPTLPSVVFATLLLNTQQTEKSGLSSFLNTNPFSALFGGLGLFESPTEAQISTSRAAGGRPCCRPSCREGPLFPMHPQAGQSGEAALGKQEGDAETLPALVPGGTDVLDSSH